MNPSELPLFDAHMHFSLTHVDQALACYQKCGVIGGINIWWGDTYKADYGEYLREMRRRKATNIVSFWWPNWVEFTTDPAGFVKRTCDDMRRYAEVGAVGIKVWKDLGMYFRHPDRTPATMDDARLEPIWRTAAELGWTVALHQADPASVFDGTVGLTRDDIFERRDRVIAAHPEIPFFLCHAGNDVESVARFAQLLDRFPNATAEVGRALERYDPVEKVRAFLTRYVDRLYIGADIAHQEDKPVSTKWNRDEAYLPMRKRMIEIWGLSGEVLEKIAWRNGQQRFLRDR